MESFVFSAPQLLFNEEVPADPRNRVTRVRPPGPIVIENVDQERAARPDSDWASLERLVQLRDVRVRPSLAHPVLMERLLPPPNEKGNMESPRSSIHFSVLSEERLNAAVKLAKRDLRRWRRESLAKSPAKASREVTLLETSDVEELEVTHLY